MRLLWLAVLLVPMCVAQNIHERETFGGLSSPQTVSDALPGPKYLQDHVVDGKLRLSLQDAVTAMLMNNSDVRLRELNVEDSKFALLRAHSPFDPAALASFSASRTETPASSDLQGATVFRSLTQTSQLGYSQGFETGTNVQIGFNATRFWTNSSFGTINPSISSALNFQLTLIGAGFVLGAVGAPLAFLTFGIGLLLVIPLALGLLVYGIIMPIVAGMKANAGEAYRYPYIIRVIK